MHAPGHLARGLAVAAAAVNGAVVVAAAAVNGGVVVVAAAVNGGAVVAVLSKISTDPQAWMA